MAQLYTTADLIDSIKDKGMIPTSQSTYTALKMLSIATEELQNGIVPMLIGVREEFYVTYKDTAIVADQAAYPIPERAVGSMVRDVLYSNDYPITAASELQNVSRKEPDQFPLNQGVSVSRGDFDFILQGNDIILDPVPTSAMGTLRQKYHIRPNRLIETTKAARVASVTSSTVVVVDSVPSTITTSGLYDVILGKPHFNHVAIDQTISSIVGTTITFASSITGIQIGDYIAAAGDSPVIQAPIDLMPVLAQRTLCQILEGLGDREGLGAATAKLMNIEKNAMTMITPRVAGEPRKIVSPYKYSWGR